MYSTNIKFQELPVFLDDTLTGRAMHSESIDKDGKRQHLSAETVPCSVITDIERISHRLLSAQRTALSYPINRIVGGKDFVEFLAATQNTTLELKEITNGKS